MTNKDFLLWIHGRLLHHGEHPLYDFMHRLRAIAASVDVERPQADSDYIHSLREIATTQEEANNSLRKQNDRLRAENDDLRDSNNKLVHLLYHQHPMLHYTPNHVSAEQARKEQNK